MNQTPERDYNDNTNTYISPREEDISQSKEYDTVIAKSIQRRPTKKHHQQKLSSTDGEILSKVDEDTRFVFSLSIFCGIQSKIHILPQKI